MKEPTVTIFHESGRLFYRANSWSQSFAYSTKTFATASEARGWIRQRQSRLR